MKKQAIRNNRSDCPISFVLELFGDKWNFLIIGDLIFTNKRHYGDFLQSPEKIATNILALLVQEGIVMKDVDPTHKSKFIYRLSQKSIDLLPILVEIILWGAQYDKCVGIVKEIVGLIKQDQEGFLNKITSQLQEELLVGYR